MKNLFIGLALIAVSLTGCKEEFEKSNPGEEVESVIIEAENGHQFKLESGVTSRVRIYHYEECGLCASVEVQTQMINQNTLNQTLFNK